LTAALSVLTARSVSPVRIAGEPVLADVPPEDVPPVDVLPLTVPP
jgi:hypothetical protein